MNNITKLTKYLNTVENKSSILINIAIYVFSLILINIINFNDEIVFIQMITLDSLLIAINFLISYMNTNINDTQIINNVKLVYKDGILDRYIFYFFVIIVLYVSRYFFWLTSDYYLDRIILILVYPSILNYVLSHEYYKKIKQIKEITTKLIISKLFSQILEHLSKQILKKDIKLQYTDFFPLIDNIGDTCGYLGQVLKNIAAVALLIYVKRYSTTYYYKLLKYIYNKKTNNNIQSIQGLDNAKQMLVDIITEKKWLEFMKPSVYNAIFILYTEDQEEQKMFENIIKYINIKSSCATTIWSISAIFNSVSFCIGLSLLFSFWHYKKTDKLEILYQMALSILLLSIRLPYFEYYSLTSFIFQFGYGMLFNKVTINVVKFLIKYPLCKLFAIVTKNVENNLYFLYVSTCVIFVSFDINFITSSLLLLNIIYNFYTNYDLRKVIVFEIIMATCYISNYNIFHIYFNTIVLYIVNANLSDYNFSNFITFVKFYCNKFNKKIYEMLFRKNNGYKIYIDSKYFDKHKQQQNKQEINKQLVALMFVHFVTKICRLVN